MFTDEDYAEFCMMMRVVSFMKSNEEVFSGNDETREAVDGLQKCVADLLELLDDRERDRLLERYQEEMQFLEQHAERR